MPRIKFYGKVEEANILSWFQAKGKVLQTINLDMEGELQGSEIRT